MSTVTDTITAATTIDAPLDIVWRLVSRPGWWLAHGPDSIEVTPADRVDRFPVETLELRPMSYAAFRWASEFAGEPLSDGRCTRIEFTLSESPAGIRVEVRESGFADLVASAEVRASALEANTSGWPEELGYLRVHAERITG